MTDWSYIFVTLYNINDVTALSLGFIFNSILIYTIWWLRNSYKGNYTKLFLISAVFDWVLSAEELLIRHQPHVKNHVMYVMGHGVEHLFPHDTFPYLMFPHGFFTIHGVFILAVQYHYRYVIMTDPTASGRQLAFDLILSISSGLIVSLGLCYGTYQSQAIPWEQWRDNIKDDWFGEYGAEHFVYASDLRFAGTKLYFALGLTFSTITLALVAYYAYKAWKFVNPANTVSRRTRHMQQQFTRTLVVQTCNAFLFSMFPITLNVTLVLFNPPGDRYYSAAVMPLISWLPAANGFMTLYVVKEFRRFALNFLSLGRLRRKINVSGPNGTNSGAESNTKNTSKAKALLP
ncbi:unnamed protein product [Bursaphelenchus xylophilus]|uniref:(pine wood nematode) hypothetical protein n=1 Tax=Bursaphelenchus xylophilus TaxID=6326 RepID=A0A1I7RXV4_BURXY|nr:unnamed protein product [Bursaphelenchus xylophilus]CAG9125191.1 unnamed protein product [Bursaphelenchus xylophilus]